MSKCQYTKLHVVHLGDAAADPADIVQQHEAADGDGKVKVPEQILDHHQEPEKPATVADAQKREVKDPVVVHDGDNKDHKNAAHLNPAQEQPKQEKQPPQVAVQVDGDLQRNLGARGVPLRQHHLEDKQTRQGDLEELHPEDIAKEEERVKQRLAQLEAEKERLEKERLDKERLEQERLEKQRLEQEKLEKERLEKERFEKDRFEKERLEAERLKQEKNELDQEIVKQAEKEQKLLEKREKLVQLQQIIESRDTNQNKVIAKEQQVPQPQKKGGRDLKVNLDPPEEEPQKEKKSREEGEMDLRRRRRDLGVEQRRVPGLEPLLELGGSDLHAALEAQLLAGAVVHSRQIKQTSHQQNTDE